jgi:hypothetical protein
LPPVRSTVNVPIDQMFLTRDVTSNRRHRAAGPRRPGVGCGAHLVVSVHMVDVCVG